MQSKWKVKHSFHEWSKRGLVALLRLGQPERYFNLLLVPRYNKVIAGGRAHFYSLHTKIREKGVAFLISNFQ